MGYNGAPTVNQTLYIVIIMTPPSPPKKEAELTAFPSRQAIFLRSPLTYGEQWKKQDLPDCHGMLINPAHVLTGATCITNFEDNPRTLDGDYYYAFSVKMVKIH